MKRQLLYLLLITHLIGASQNPFIKVHQLIVQNEFKLSNAILDSCENKKYFQDSVYYYKGLAAIKSSNIGECEKYCVLLTKEFPTFYDVHYLKGLLHFQKQNFGKSATEFTKLLKHNPKDVKALYNRSIALGYMEDYLDAIKDLDSCVAINPNFAIGYYSRAYWYEYTGNNQAATKDYLNSIKLDPKNYDAYFGLAFIYQTLKEPKKACEIINQAIAAGSQIGEEIKESFCR